jgi:hypothetical protein
LANPVQFTITGTANSTAHGYSAGESYTFTFRVNHNYTGGDGDSFLTSSSEWKQSSTNDPNIFLSITGDSLTGTYSPVFEPNGQSHYALSVVEEDGNQELWFSADTSASGFDIGLQTPDGSQIGDFAVEIVLENFSVPYSEQFVNPTEFWSTYAGSYTLTNSLSWFNFDAYLPGVDEDGDPNQEDLISFTATSLLILPESSTGLTLNIVPATEEFYFTGSDTGTTDAGWFSWSSAGWVGNEPSVNISTAFALSGGNDVGYANIWFANSGLEISISPLGVSTPTALAVTGAGSSTKFSYAFLSSSLKNMFESQSSLPLEDGNGFSSIFVKTVSDSDADGIPDIWEQQYFGGSTNANPRATCSNGINTVRQAYIAGLDPNDPNAALLSSILPSRALQWSAVSGRVYSVYFSTNLLTAFQCLESNIPWTRACFTNPATDPQGFYKIDVKLAP